MSRGKGSLGSPTLSERLLAPLAVLSTENEVVDVNVGALVRRLLLFEEVVVQSVGLREIPFLVEALGPEGVIELLNSGSLRFAADEWYVAQVGQSDVIKPRTGSRGPLPLGSFTFSSAAFIPEGYVDPSTPDPGSINVFKAARKSFFDELRTKLSVQGKANQHIREATGKALIERTPGPLGEEVFPALAADLNGHPALLRQATARALAARLDREIDPDTFKIAVHQVHEREFAVETDLGERFRLSAQDEHKVVEQGMLGVAGVNHRLDDMKTYRALGGLKGEELPILEEKFSFLASEVDPERQEERFDRVVELAGLPEVELAGEQAIDVERLLEVRSSEECRDFRAWLRRLDSADDHEIEERVASLAEAVKRAVHSRPGRIARFVTTNGLSVVAGFFTAGLATPAAEIGLEALDEFVVGKVIGHPGPASFLHRSYPSIFKG